MPLYVPPAYNMFSVRSEGIFLCEKGLIPVFAHYDAHSHRRREGCDTFYPSVSLRAFCPPRGDATMCCVLAISCVYLTICISCMDIEPSSINEIMPESLANLKQKKVFDKYTTSSKQPDSGYLASSTLHQYRKMYYIIHIPINQSSQIPKMQVHQAPQLPRPVQKKKKKTSPVFRRRCVVHDDVSV